jgi:hypothetical protein
MLRLMIGGFAAIASGLFSGLAVMPVKASPPTAIIISGPSVPVPGPVLSSRSEADHPAPKLEPAAAPNSESRTYTADEPATPASPPTRAASTKAKSAPAATARSNPRIRIARRDDDDGDDD